MSANPNIYLHEIVRTVPGREEPYLASVLSLHHEPSRAGLGHPAFAQFRTVPGSGPWPLAINVWENTWAGQTADLVGQFLDTERDVAMEEWWNRNLHLRRGGYDRLLVPTPWSPTLADLEAGGVTGEVFLQEIAWLPFGEPDRYLDALEALRPVLAGIGVTVVGAWTVAMRPRQVLTLFAAQTWSGITDLADALDPALAAWRDRRATTIDRLEEMLLLPARHGPLVAPRPGHRA